MFSRILVGNDGSKGASKALQMAIYLAKRYQAELHQVTVKERLPYYVEEVGKVGRVLDTDQNAANYLSQVTKRACTEAAAAGIKLVPHVIHGDSVAEINKIALHHGFNLLVIGFNGHSAMFGHQWGSTSQQLASSAACSVLIVK